LPFKPAPTDEALAVRRGLTQFVPKQKANATYNSLRAQFCDRGYFAQALRKAPFLMWRAILEPALLFASPFAAYTIYLVLRRNYPFAMEHWTKSAVSTLTLAGLAIAVTGMIAFGIFAPRHVGAYVPAHIENGKLVPGRLQ
jgi:Family of unknown function (DUF6111)